MSWSLRHRLIILLIVCLFFGATAGILYAIYRPRPNCFDGKLNQTELDIDCGGGCAAVCPREVSAPVVWWQQAFAVRPGQYDVAALIENRNKSFGLTSLEYAFRIFDNNQLLIATVPGKTFMNSGEKTMLFVPNVNTGEREAFRVTLDLATTTWKRLPMVPISLTISEPVFTNTPLPQVRATIRNDSLITYRDVAVAVALADAAGNVFAVSQTRIPVLGRGETSDVVFSWPTPFPDAAGVLPVITIYPRINTVTPSSIK